MQTGSIYRHIETDRAVIIEGVCTGLKNKDYVVFSPAKYIDLSQSILGTFYTQGLYEKQSGTSPEVLEKKPISGVI
jgi:hypothetical protein